MKQGSGQLSTVGSWSLSVGKEMLIRGEIDSLVRRGILIDREAGYLHRLTDVFEYFAAAVFRFTIFAIL